MADQYDMLAHMKRSMRNTLDGFQQGNIDKDETLDSLSIAALEYHNVMLRRITDEITARTQQQEAEDGEETEG